MRVNAFCNVVEMTPSRVSAAAYAAVEGVVARAREGALDALLEGGEGGGRTFGAKEEESLAVAGAGCIGLALRAVRENHGPAARADLAKVLTAWLRFMEASIGLVSAGMATRVVRLVRELGADRGPPAVKEEEAVKTEPVVKTEEGGALRREGERDELEKFDWLVKKEE